MSIKKKLSQYKIPRAAVYLGIGSLFTDISSETIYPLLPIFLTTVLGATPMFVGLFEGVAESTASITKFFSGYYSDRIKKREPFVLAGYTLANGVRPFIAVVTAPWHALGLRFVDRIGKGIRGAPRDAWLAQLSTPKTRGWVFGFDRAMDHTGAILGPMLATIYLSFYPGHYRTLFLFTLVPGAMAIGAVLLAKKATVTEPIEKSPTTNISIPFLGSLPFSFKYYLFVLFIFTLSNSSDAFLILKLKDVGLEDKWIPLSWAGLHIVKMSTSFLGGFVSDKVGRRIPILAGWILYAAIYFFLGMTTKISLAIALFWIYGLFYGLTESPEKAFIADIIPSQFHGRAYGLYNLIIGITALPASLLFGLLWKTKSLPFAFNISALLAIISCFLLALMPSTSYSKADK